MIAIAVIPARFASTRFPGMPLAEIHGKPMVQHVYERARAARRISRVIVATEDERVARAVEAFGGEAALTSPDHASGSDRVAEAARGVEADIVVNVQGDEPMLDPHMVDEAVDLLARTPGAGIATLMRRIESQADYANPGFVKVVTDARGMALYFSRSLIPFPRTATPDFHAYDHIGLYAFTGEALARFRELVWVAKTRSQREANNPAV